MCGSPEEKEWGKCKFRNVVYETQCMTCYNNTKGEEKVIARINDIEPERKDGKKRTREEEERECEVKEDKKRKVVKYVGETSRSGYERQIEHFKDYKNLYLRSHILKHYLDCHQDISLEKLEVRMRVIGRYRSSFERQIGESIWLNSYLKEGVIILNSKNEYNRCSIPRLGLELKSEDALEEFKEKQEEQRRKSELKRLKERLRYEGNEQKHKKRRVNIEEEIADEMTERKERRGEVELQRELQKYKEMREEMMKLPFFYLVILLVRS